MLKIEILTDIFVIYMKISIPVSKVGVSNLFLQRANYKFKNVVRAACKKLMIIQTLNDELKLSLY